MEIKRGVVIFLRAQVGAFSGGIADYALMLILTEWVGIHFTISILISGSIGGLVNFLINRYWAFRVHHGYVYTTSQQLVRFSVVVLGSILLKSGGTFMLHRLLRLNYKIGRLLIDLLVSYFFNYPLMRWWVFRLGAKILKLKHQ